MSKKNNLRVLYIGFFIIFLCLYVSYINIEYFDNIPCKLFTNAVSPKKVHIWYDAGNNMLPFMYKPVTSSLVRIIQYLHKDLLIDFKTIAPDTDPTTYTQIQPNDILIWVGIDRIVDFKKFKEKGVYTIYYNTEPAENCDYCNSRHTGEPKYYSHEIWTYSKFLLHNYVKDESGQIIKFVPILYEENTPRIPYNSSAFNNISVKLIFIGNLDFRHHKKEILFKSELIKNNLSGVNDLWGDEVYNKYMVENPHLHLNLTKGDSKTLPSVRINKLLSHGAIIISEHTNPIDEKLYKDMVHFCKLEDVEIIYKQLSSRPREELQKDSDKILNNFYQKFNITKICNLIEQK